MTARQKLKQSTQRSADSMIISAAVLASWLLETYTGVQMPGAVEVAISGMLGSIGAHIAKGSD